MVVLRSLALSTAILVAGACFCLSAKADATDEAEFVLRLAHSFPPNHSLVRNATLIWMNKVIERTSGRVAFDYFPSEQLGKAKDLLSLTQSGVVDISYITAGLMSDKLPLAAVAELPEPFETACQGTLAYWQLAKKGGVIDRREFEPLGVRALLVLVMPPYQIYMAKDPITSSQDFGGRKIRSAGGAKSLVVQALGGVPVFIPGPEILEALSRGTVDGAMLSHPSVTDYDLQHDVKYATYGENFGSAVTAHMISLKDFNALPPDIQNILVEAGEEVTLSSCSEIDAEAEHSVSTIKDAGLTYVRLSPEDHEQVVSELSGIGRDWAADLDRRRRAGTEVLQAFRRALRQVIADQTSIAAETQD